MSRGLKKALIDAADRGDVKRIQELLDKNVKVDSVVEEWTPIMHAAFHGHLQAVQLLLNHHANVNHITKDDSTAINLAAGRGFWDIVRLLEQAGANVHHKNLKGKSAMDYARHAKQKHLLKEWQQRHAEPENAS
ncbi:MAG: ankyrin repeat domain-containing protein [Pirellulaceae bacterium]